MADAPPAPIKLTLHHQVVINLVGFVVCCDWTTEADNRAMALAEIAARLPLAPLTGHPEADAVLTAAAAIDAAPTSILQARAAVARFLFIRAAQAQVAADKAAGAPAAPALSTGANDAA